jgi:GGDEF domain-containing protein
LRRACRAGARVRSTGAGADGSTWYKTAMAPDAPRRRRARPVADAPIDTLLARSEDLAKGWVLALVESAPLHEAPRILTDALTRDGPRVCDAALRALADESDLRRLAPGGALRPLIARVGEMTGATNPGAAVRAVDALHDVMWSALRSELDGLPDPDLVSDLAERLALVCATVRDAVLEGAAGGERELSAVPPSASPAPEPPRVSDPSPRYPDPRWDPPPASAGGRATGTPLWMGALEDEVRHSGVGAAPLSLLLAELEDAERVAASASPERAGAAFGDFVAALRRVLRRQDILVCETDARAWVIARETSRAGAHSLGVRIAEAVGESSSLGGAPLVASIGVAVLGEDGASSGELIEAAEEARFAASARGVEVSRRPPD